MADFYDVEGEGEDESMRGNSGIYDFKHPAEGAY